MNIKIKLLTKILTAWYLFSSLLLGQVFIYTWINMVFFDQPVKWVGNVFQADTDKEYIMDQVKDLNEAVFGLKKEAKK